MLFHIEIKIEYDWSAGDIASGCCGGSVSALSTHPPGSGGRLLNRVNFLCYISIELLFQGKSILFCKLFSTF